MNAATLVSDARLAGVKFRLVDGTVKVSGNATLWADRLKASRLELIDYLTREAANDLLQAPGLVAGGLVPQQDSAEPPFDPNAWRELAAAYNLHHFKCAVCIAAGRGAGYGLRCGVGAALWWVYQDLS